MATYISSSENRFYAVLEESYGTVPAITAASRFPATSFQATQERVSSERRDKTGSRSAGMPAFATRRDTEFRMDTYHVTRASGTDLPVYSAMLQAALGNPPTIWAGGVVDSMPGPNRVRFVAPHGLSVGQGLVFGGELRFASAILDATTVELSAAFGAMPSSGSPIGGTVSYALGRTLSSVSVFDYWSPDSAVHRIACGAAVDRLKVTLNGDFHEIRFEGAAADLIDSASFVSGQGELASFPIEPTIAPLSYSPVPGHLGQAWIGALPERFYTLTDASVLLSNGIQLRNREFGSAIARSFSAGRRTVSVSFSLYEQDNVSTRSLYQAARTQQPIQVMFQLGQQPGHLMGLLMKAVIPEVPEFDDKGTQVRWKFSAGQAYGLADDELYVCFG